MNATWRLYLLRPLLVFVVCFSGLPSGAQVLNGDFANGTIGCNTPSGWKSNGTIQIADYFQSGNNWVDITGCGFGNGNWIEQEVRTTPGMYYRIKLDLGTWWGWGIEDAGVDITINGNQLGKRYYNDSFTKSFTVNLHWETITTCDFLATGHKTTIRFTGHGLCSKFSPSTACSNPNPGVIAVDNIYFSDSLKVDVDTNICMHSDTVMLGFKTTGNIAHEAEWFMNGSSVGKDKTYQATVKGDYVLKIKTACNTIAHTVHLNFAYMSRSFRLCAGDTLKVGKHQYDKAGDYTDTFPGINSCDTVVKTHVEIGLIDNSRNISLCEGRQIAVGNNVYDKTGDYVDTLKGISACDTILHTHLVIVPSSRVTQVLTICEGGQVSVGSKVYKQAGVYADTLQSYSLCDSIVITQVSVLPKSYITQDVSICEGDYFKIGKHLYTTAGTYTDTIPNFRLCDSIVTTHLHVEKSSYTRYKDSFCEGKDFVLGNRTYYNDGVYYDTIPNYNGCDSIIELELNFRSEYACNCDQLNKPANVFTPNNDGINDFFPNYFMPGMILWVYDRWGILVYSSDDGYGWNGKIRNNALPTGTYYYLMEFNDCSKAHMKSNGVVTLIR